MGGNRQPFGTLAEDLACEWLTTHGYRVVERNYRGVRGELDIVAMDGDVMCFVEVKALRDPSKDVCPEMEVTARKRGRVLRTAREYLIDRHIRSVPCRFDVVAIVYRGDVAEVRLSKGAFDGSELPPSMR